MFRLIITLFALFWLGTQATAAKLALVIGNSDYDALSDLDNPKADALGYRDALEALGYHVTFAENLDRDAMETVIIGFLDRVQEGDETFVVYTGHGWSDGQVNYLLPVDAPDRGSERRLKRHSVPLKNGYDGLLDELAALGARLQVAIVDACRDNPFRTPPGTRSLGLGRGLARVQPPEGAFVIFSAGAGQTALDRLPDDDAAEKLSVFTRHFLPLLTSDLTLEDAISVAQTRTAETAKRVGHVQRPSYYDETLGKTCLREECRGLVDLAALNATAAVAQPSLCDRLYEETKALGQCYAYEDFLSQCPEHAFAGLADRFVGSQCRPGDTARGNSDSDPASVLRCDALAASPFDTELPASMTGVKFEEIDAGAAVAACRAATSEQPSHPRATFSLGRALEAQGEISEARAFYRVADGLGHLAATTALGRLARDGAAAAPDLESAIGFLSRAADKGDPVAMTHLARIYELDGGRAYQDFAKAQDNLNRAVALGHPHAIRELARSYHKGTLYRKDPAKALELYQQAAALGDFDAQYEAAMMHWRGVDGVIDADKTRALELLKGIAKKGNVIAQMRVGTTYLYGITEQDGTKIAPNLSEALRWLTLAADAGHVNAQVQLGKMYRDGTHGLTADASEALRWFQKAADNQFIFGLLTVGEMYEAGLGTDPDPVRAAQNFYRALERGSLEPDRRVWSSRDTAREMQRLMRQSGYYSGPLDGAIGAGSKSAMRKIRDTFRKSNRMFDTGIRTRASNQGWKCQC